MNTFYNGKEINKENLLDMIRESIDDKWKNSDLSLLTEQALERIALKDYEGRDEDIECIIEKLNAETERFGYEYKDANLQSVEIIISEGSWYFQE